MVRELSLTLKNAFLGSSRIKPYVIISESAHEALRDLEIGKIQVKVMEAAAAQIKEICDARTEV